MESINSNSHNEPIAKTNTLVSSIQYICHYQLASNTEIEELISANSMRKRKIHLSEISKMIHKNLHILEML